MFALRLLLMGADAVVAVITFLLVGLLRFGDAGWPTMWDALAIDVRLGAVAYAAAWVTTLWYLGLYEFRVRWTIAAELEEILVAAFVLAFATMSFLFLVKLVDVSRLFLLILLIAQSVVTILGQIAFRLFFNWLRGRGYNRAYMVIVGVGPEAQAFADAVESHRELGIEVVGHLRGPDEIEDHVTRPVLGRGEDLGQVFHDQTIDEVAICVSERATDWVTPLVRLAADEGKHVRVPTRLPARSLDHQTEELDGMVVRSYVHGPARFLSLMVKRVVDIAGSVAGMILLSPIFLVVAIAINLADGRPVLFHQTRVGLHGRTFRLHKFRTMEIDAEAHLADVRHLNERDAIAFKASNDPRVTPLGRRLRALSLDELPQLWNVLKGEMSLVGPRPPLVAEVAAYDAWHRRRLSMRPGITGLWQVEARQEPGFDRWVERDLDYIDQWSLGMDLRILLKTVPAVIARTGQ